MSTFWNTFLATRFSPVHSYIFIPIGILGFQKGIKRDKNPFWCVLIHQLHNVLSDFPSRSEVGWELLIVLLHVKIALHVWIELVSSRPTCTIMSEPYK